MIGGVGTALGDFFHGKSQAKELAVTIDLSREYEKEYSKHKVPFEFSGSFHIISFIKEVIDIEIEKCLKDGMSPVEASLAVLSATKNVMTATKMTKNAMEAFEKTLVLSFPGKFQLYPPSLIEKKRYKIVNFI